MGVLLRVAESFGLTAPAKGVVAKFIERGLVNRPLTPIWDVKRFADEGYRRNVLVWACIKLRMRSAAQVKLVAKKPNQNGDLEPLPANHPLQKLLLKPNAEQSQREWVKKAFMHLDVGGNVYIHKVRARSGQIVELWLLRPDQVAVVPDVNGFVGGYQFPYDRQDITPRVGTLAPKDIVHYKEDDYLDDYYGISKIAVLARQGDIDNESADYMRAVLLNSGAPTGALKVKSEHPIGREAKDMLRNEWTERVGRGLRRVGSWLGMSEFPTPESDNRGGIAVMDADVEYIKIGSHFNEMNLDGIFQHTETRICSVFGVPPSSIGAKAGLDRNTYSNAEQTDDWFWNNTMVPEVNDFYEKLTAELAPEFGEGIVIEGDFANVRALQEDQDARAERSGKGWDAGVIQFDEYRLDLGKEAVGEDALMLDEETGEEIAALGKKYKWQLPMAKQALNGNGQPEEEEEEEDEERPMLPAGDEEEDEDMLEAASRRVRYLPKPRLMLAAGKKPSWKRLHDAVDERTLAMRRCVAKGFKLGKDGIEIQALANALFVKDSMKAEALALTAFKEQGVPVIRKTLCRDLGSLYRSGAKVGMRDARVKLGTGPTETLAPPNLDPGEDDGFAETRVAELVTDVTEATRATIRGHVEGMLQDGYSARRAATRIRDTVGLTKPGLRRLQKYEERKIAAGVTGDELESLLSKFSRKLIRERALTIARTEGIRAVSEGQSSIWEKAVESGILPQDQEQMWVVTEDDRACPICVPMDGQKVRIGEVFDAGDGSKVYAPPAHVNCRCARAIP